jgi:hypothetical protein
VEGSGLEENIAIAIDGRVGNLALYFTYSSSRSDLALGDLR